MSEAAASPLVSVIVPTHDRPHLLRLALQSIAAQTLRSVEAVVVNDGGPDVAELVDSIAGLDAVYLAHETSRERSAARNTGLAAARGRWIAYLDDDDVFLPEHLDTLVSAVRRHGVRAAYSDAARELRRVVAGEEVVLTTDVPYSVDYEPDRLRHENFIPIISVLHERSCLDEVGLFDTSFSALEDWELFLRLAAVTDFVHVPQVTARFGERVDGTRGDFLAAAERLFAKHPLPPGRADLERLRAGYLAGLRTIAARPPASARPLTTIAIPTFNHLELTRQCIDAIQRTTEPGSYEIVVVDNGSTDGTPAWLADQDADGRLRAVLNDGNRGFSAACNQGAALARGEVVLFLNNDTIPHPGWLDAVQAELAEHPETGIVGSKLLYANGTIQHAGVVVGEREGEGDPFPFHVYLCQPADAPHVSRRREFQFVTGACLAIRRELHERVGGFDEAFWNGHEDLDLCLKARAAGAKVVYRPDSVVTHLESQTKRLLGLEQFHYAKGADTPEAKGRALFLERWRDTIELDEKRVLAEDGFGDGLHVLFTMTGWADEGGGTILPRQIAKALVRRGHRVTVLTAPVQEVEGAPAYHLRGEVDDGVRVIYVHNRPSRFNDPLNPDRELEDPRLVALARELAAELKPDVVHLHSLLGLSLALPEALGGPTLYTSHNYWPICPRMYLFRDDLSLCDGPQEPGLPTGAKCASCLGQPALAPAYARRLEAGTRALGRHLAVSQRVKDLFVAAGHDAAGIHVLYQQPETVGWIWDEAGSSREPVERLERPLRVGFIGSLYPHKGAHVVVAAAQLAENVEVHLFGGGSPQYVERLRALDATGRVVFHGGYEPSQLPELLASVDVVCVPSLWEDCAPLTVAESLAARAPVLGSAIGGITEFFRDGVDGIAVPPGDAAALAAVFGRFAAEPELLGRLQAAIESPRGFDAYLDELEEHYRSALASHRLRPARPIAGARSLAVLAFADELADDPALLAAWGRSVRGGDDATLVIHGRGSEQELGALLGPAIAAAGLEEDGSADLLAVVDADEERLAAGVVAVLSRRAPTVALARLPHVDEAGVAELRALLDAA